MRVLVIGASGYVGGSVAIYLKCQGHDIIAQMRGQNLVSENWSRAFDQVIIGDVLGLEIQEKIRTEKFDAVIFAVGMDYRQSSSSVAQILDTNVGLLWQFFELLRGRVGCLIYFSTQQVYGSFGAAVHETDQCAPKNTHGLSHLMAEQVCTYYHQPPSACAYSLRLSNVYGRPAYLSPRFLHFSLLDLCYQAVNKSTIQLQSDGSPQRDFIHISDVCIAVERLLTRKPNGTIFNLGSGQTLSIGALAAAVQAYARAKEHREVAIIDPRGQPVNVRQTSPDFTYDISALRSLGFQPAGDLTAGIAESFAYVHEVLGQKNPG